MDADNLGFIISQGVRPRLPEGNQGALSAVPGGSLARLAGLSRTLELFFGGYIEELLRERFSDVYLVYSGGDDLVAIGPWSRILDLAGEIREQFRRFTADNPVWSLSAGVAVINPHVPVLVAIAEADRLLEVSKNIVGAGILPYPPPEDVSAAGESPKKNRITVFETSIPWDEFGPMMAQAKRLTTWVRQGVVSTGQVRCLMYYAGLAAAISADTRYPVSAVRSLFGARFAPHMERAHYGTSGGQAIGQHNARCRVRWRSLRPGSSAITRFMPVGLPSERIVPMKKGTIKVFYNDRGFGFIRPEAGEQEIFFHKNVVRDMGYPLEEGAPVEYEEGPGRKPGERQATRVVILGYPADPAPGERRPAPPRLEVSGRQLPPECIFEKSFYGRKRPPASKYLYEAAEAAARASRGQFEGQSTAGTV